MSSLFYLFLCFSLVSGLHQILPEPPEEIYDYLQPEFIDTHLNFLSLKALKGRGPGTTGEKIAAEYITKELSSYQGIIGAGDKGGFKAQVPLVGTTVTKISELTFTQTKTQINQTYQFGTEYTTGTDYLQSTLESLAGEKLVFVGYGIDAPDYNWDDYKGVDVTGKVLLMFVSQPNVGAFQGQPLTYYGRWTYKFEEGRAKKAKAVLLIHTDETAGYPWSVVQSGWAGEVVTSAQQVDHPLVATGWITSQTAENLFSLYGTSLSQMFTAADSSSFSPIDLGFQVSVEMSLSHRHFEGVSVLGLLPGEDTKNAIVYSGHLDHLGVKNGEVYPGAIDDASGASMVLNLAYAFSQLNQTLKRSILFFFPTAEESGLIGSDYYAKNSTLNILSCINFDIANVWGETQDLAILGEGKSTLGDLFEECAGLEGMYLSPDPAPSTGLFFRSDHFSFAKVGVPGVWVYIGSHFVGQPDTFYNTTVQDGYFGTIYHTPLDAYRSDFNYDGLIQQLRVSLRVGFGIANSDTTPKCYTTCT